MLMCSVQQAQQVKEQGVPHKSEGIKSPGQFLT